MAIIPACFAQPYFEGFVSYCMALTDIIIEKIKAEGPIAFRNFMDMCLYHPELGYYISDREKVGKDGDFYTTSNLTSSFGAMIARQMEEMWHVLGGKNFTIVEYGAGTGFLCHDIINYLKRNQDLYDQLQYCIIEKSPFMQGKEKEHLTEKVSWYDTIDDIPGQVDCVFSNELVDNFPVHQVVMQQQLMEVFVDYKNGFIEVLKPAGLELNTYFNELGVILPEGYRTEVNLDAILWIKSIATRLKKGFVMTIDYGDFSEHFYKPHRSSGTVVSYNKHKVSGMFTAIPANRILRHMLILVPCPIGEPWKGLVSCGLTPQACFLVSLGFQEHIKETSVQEGKDILQIARELAFINHTLLFEMGNKFKVLIQSKGLPDVKLSGLQMV
jgi:SAM-dependent MidA family methyltransferase